MFPPPLFTCSHSRKKLHRCRFVSLEDVKTALQETWEVEKVALSIASRSYTNAGKSVLSPKVTTLKKGVFIDVN